MFGPGKSQNEPKFTEQIIIDQSFPYVDPNTNEELDNWQTICQPWVESQIGQGRNFFGAKRDNPEILGLITTFHYIKGLDNEKKYRITCTQGIFLVLWIINLPRSDKNEIHLKKYPR